MITLVLGIIERGLIFSLIVAGVYLTSRLIKFDDLSVEGSFGIGGALIAACLTNGISFALAIPAAIIAGGACGLITGLLHTKLKMNNLMSGIVVTTGAFSVMLKLSSSTVSLGNTTTIFKVLPGLAHNALLILVPIALGIIMLIRWFLTTEVGFLIQGCGDNKQMLINLGKNPDNYILIPLVISNMLSALSGALFVQYVGFFSLWGNVGILIMSLAGLILAQIISKKFGIALIFGACMYQAIIALTFELNIDQDWNKLIIALFMVALIVITKQIKGNRL